MKLTAGVLSGTFKYNLTFKIREVLLSRNIVAPFGEHISQCGSWAFGGADLVVAYQSVVGSDLAFGYTFRDESLDHFQLLLWWCFHWK